MPGAAPLRPRLTDLEETDRFIIRATRHWLALLRARHGAVAQADALKTKWHQAFRAAGGRHAARAWEDVLAYLAHHARRPVHLGCPCCGRVSPDELRLVLCVAAAQTNTAACAIDLLSHWLSTADSPPALAAVHRFSLHLAAHGLRLPPATPRRLRHLTTLSMIEHAPHFVLRRRSEEATRPRKRQ